MSAAFAIPAAELKRPVFAAAANAAARAADGKASLVGYDETSGMFEYEVRREDGTTQIVCVHLLLECFAGAVAYMPPALAGSRPG